MKSLVMIVDDHAIIRHMVRVMFESENFDVSDAADGAEGVHKAQAEKPSLIILDLSMPVMDGLEAVTCLDFLIHVELRISTFRQTRWAYDSPDCYGVVRRCTRFASLRSSLSHQPGCETSWRSNIHLVAAR